MKKKFNLLQLSDRQSTLLLIFTTSVIFILLIAFFMKSSYDFFKIIRSNNLNKKVVFLQKSFLSDEYVHYINSVSHENNYLDEHAFKSLDVKWKLSLEDNFLFKSIINNKLSLSLKDFQNNFPEFVEIFITDKNGLIVGLTNKTTDYYQADELWWQASKVNGIFIGNLEYDSSVQSWSYSISISIFDHDNKFLGVLKAVIAEKFLYEVH